jgi:hypothetical protein
LKQVVETKSAEIFESIERISQPFYNGGIGITLGMNFMVDEAFDQSSIGSAVDRADLRGSAEEQSSEWLP